MSSSQFTYKFQNIITRKTKYRIKEIGEKFKPTEFKPTELKIILYIMYDISLREWMNEYKKILTTTESTTTSYSESIIIMFA